MFLKQGCCDGYVVICYYESWDRYRQPAGPIPMTPEDINPFLCTHINYAFAVVDITTANITTHTLNVMERNDKGNYKEMKS